MTGAPARPVHGGGVDAFARRHGLDPREILDFSSNVNPYGPPASVRLLLARAARDSSLLGRYPDDTHAELRGALARLFRVPPDAVVIGNGTSALLHEIVRLLRPRTCLLPVPAFSEYAHALRGGGCRRVEFPLQAERAFRLDAESFAGALLRTRPSLAIVNNPHNPSGALVTAPETQRLMDAARRARTLLVFDEAFIDYAPPQASRTASAAAADSVVVLRSLTKLYGMPALRVGCAVAAPPFAERLRALLPSWPVGTLAAAAAREAVRDGARFAARMRVRNGRARRALARALAGLGCRVFPSAANFLLVQLPEGAPSAAKLQEALAASRLIVRDVGSYAGLAGGRFLRLAVRRPRENSRLVGALRTALGGAEPC
jgi:threonine-phosphate decarboxylase